MSGEDVIAMATEKGLAYKSKYLATNDNYQFNEERLLDFSNAIAAKAAADEREACADIADSMDACQDGAIGKAIRARSNT